MTERVHSCPLDPDRVIEESCRYFGVSRSEMAMSNGRSWHLIGSRGVAGLVLRDRCSMSYPEIAAILSTGDHATRPIGHGAVYDRDKTFRNLMRVCEAIRDAYATISERSQDGEP